MHELLLLLLFPVAQVSGICADVENLIIHIAGLCVALVFWNFILSL
jgi:hypothetical protein